VNVARAASANQVSICNRARRNFVKTNTFIVVAPGCGPISELPER
jgi:hypothetical protein